MRLLCTLKDDRKGRDFSLFLKEKGIDNEWELVTNTDWGSEQYGDRSCRIWIIEEDQFETAKGWYEKFNQSPDDPKFIGHEKTVEEANYEEEEAAAKLLARQAQEAQTLDGISTWHLQPVGHITLYLIVSCVVLFFWGEMNQLSKDQVPFKLPAVVANNSPIKTALLYDYPHAFELMDQFIALYRKERWTATKDVSEEGRQLLEQYSRTPYWQGYYSIAVSRLMRQEETEESSEIQTQNAQAFKTEAGQSASAQWFEKIRQGEVWRIVSPTLLHNDILHLLFNMLWLYVLGKQLEQRMGGLRYLLFCVIAGAVSDTAQYLMTGPNFIGFSGILCAMLAFIWVRQRKSPWEGYMLQKGTFAFLGTFIMAMFLLQVASFYTEITRGVSLPITIANTAHISGAVIGFVLGYVPFFAWKKR